MVPIEETFGFFTCYRLLINTYRLAPETEETQLAEILRRVREANASAPSKGGGRPGAANVQAGG